MDSRYQYIYNRFYIEDKNDAKISEDKSRMDYDFQWVFKRDDRNFSLEDDGNMNAGSQYLGCIHELTHYFQDLSVCSCIAERIYKTKYSKCYIDNIILRDKPPYKVTEKEIEVYNKIYKTSIGVATKSVIEFSENCGDFCFVEFESDPSNKTDYLPIIKYRDLIECYAEMKAWQSIITENYENDDRHEYIAKLLINRNTRSGWNSIEDCFDFYYYLRSVERYSVIRKIFLAFFSYVKKCDFWIHNKIRPKSNTSIIQLLMSLGQFPDEELIEYPNGYTYKKRSHVPESVYLKEYELILQQWLLFSLDVAMTIPTTETIARLVDEDKYKLEDFHPCCRFYKVLGLFFKYSTYFNNLEGEYIWSSVFNDIANTLHWPSYEFTANDISCANKFFHNGNIVFYQDHFLAYHMNSTIRTNSIAILWAFRDMKIPIFLHFNNKYMVLRYSHEKTGGITVMNEYLVDENQLTKYYTHNPREFESYNDCFDSDLFCLYANDLNMKLYNNIISKEKFDCVYRQPRCEGECTVHSLVDVLNRDSKTCQIFKHISYEWTAFIKRHIQYFMNKENNI